MELPDKITGGRRGVLYVITGGLPKPVNLCHAACTAKTSCGSVASLTTPLNTPKICPLVLSLYVTGARTTEETFPFFQYT